MKKPRAAPGEFKSPALRNNILGPREKLSMGSPIVSDLGDITESRRDIRRLETVGYPNFQKEREGRTRKLVEHCL